MYNIILFLFGICIGSFLNVVIYRIGTGMKIANDRSKCFHCNKTLSYLELIPIFSYLFQKGKCRKCKSKISAQYLFVELVTGLMFIMAGMNILNLIIVSLMMVIIVYDMKHRIIPDIINYLFMFFCFFISYNVFHGLIAAVPFFLLWFVSRGRWIGFGDVKLMIGIGLLTGKYWPSTIFFAFMTGGIFSIFYIIYKTLRKEKYSREIAFGPFLIIGAIIVYFFGIDFCDVNNVCQLYNAVK